LLVALAYGVTIGKGAGRRCGQISRRINMGDITMASGKRVLVVEDNELNLRLFCDLLTAHGYTAEAVQDGRDVLAKAAAVQPDLIIMDIQLPHVSGLDLIRSIKSDVQLNRTPILAVTAYAGRDDEQRIRDAGAESYISKPISVMRFIEAVDALV
jgi:two-component system cell cycle response regulator DivK